MKQKIWQTQQTLNQAVEIYTTGRDILLDQQLVGYDIYGSLSHAQMLFQQQLIGDYNLAQLIKGLKQILKQYQAGQYILVAGDEDMHSRIENDLTKKYPKAGSKLHTGRSRNDQILVDLRLFSKDKLQSISLEIIDLIFLLIKNAQQYQQVALPGLTHMQPAMLSSIGLWLSSFAESLLDDLQIITSAYELNNQSPLGSGAAYGVSLPIDREVTAQKLGFAKVQNNALYCQNSRGKIEGLILHALVQVMATLNKLATDLLLFTTEPFTFLSFDQALGTGSSIMPQKQNWDALELMRARYHTVLSYEFQISSNLANLPSGYNRDFQEMKEPLLKSFELVSQSIGIASLHIANVQINVDQINQHLPKELDAAYWTYELMGQKKLPFRTAYRFVKDHLSEIPEFNQTKVLISSKSQGGPGNLGLKKIILQTQKNKSYWQREQLNFQQLLQRLIK